MGLDTKPKSHLADYKHPFLSHSFQYFRGVGGVSEVSWRIDDDDNTNATELGYNDIGLCDTSSITLYILWYQLIPQTTRFFLSRLVRHTRERLPRI